MSTDGRDESAGNVALGGEEIFGGFYGGEDSGADGIDGVDDVIGSEVRVGEIHNVSALDPAFEGKGIFEILGDLAP